MIRKDNVARLEKIKKETGISVTRLVNIAIKEFLENNLNELDNTY